MFRFRETDFAEEEEEEHEDGTSPGWSLTYADLEPYYTMAEQLFAVRCSLFAVTRMSDKERRKISLTKHPIREVAMCRAPTQTSAKQTVNQYTNSAVTSRPTAWKPDAKRSSQRRSTESTYNPPLRITELSRAQNGYVASLNRRSCHQAIPEE